MSLWLEVGLGPVLCVGRQWGCHGGRALFSVWVRKGLREEMVLNSSGKEEQKGERKVTFQAEGFQEQRLWWGLGELMRI